MMQAIREVSDAGSTTQIIQGHTSNFRYKAKEPPAVNPKRHHGHLLQLVPLPSGIMPMLFQAVPKNAIR
jgi:hypothetical protein